MKTILHICDWYQPIGGSEKLLTDSLDLLEQRGYKNIVVYNDHDGQIPTGRRPEYSVSGLEPYAYFRPWVYMRRNAPVNRISELIDKYEPEVCHIHNLQNPFVMEALVHKVPCVRAVHDPRLYCFTHFKLLPDRSVCRYPMGRKCFEHRCLSRGLFPKTFYDKNAFWALRTFNAHRAIHVLIAESRWVIACLTDNGFSPEQIAWLPNFTFVKPEAETRSYLDDYFRPEEKTVVCVGRAVYEKGIHVLVEACRHIRCDCRVVIITAGEYLEEIKSRASRFPDRITVIPGLPYEETRRWYARASVVVVPSIWPETFGIVGLEAYASMKPVIGSRIGGIQDWIKDGETGWFVNPGDPEDLARKIDTAMSDPERTCVMGYAAYRRVSSFYGPNLYVERLLEAYDLATERFAKTV